MFKIITFLICSPALCFQCFSQEIPRFSKSQIEGDFKIFRGSLQDFHPGIYWYRSKAEMDSIFDYTYQHLPDSLSEFDFYRSLAKVITFMGCGHTGAWYSEKTSRNPDNRYFPLKLWFDGDEAFLVRKFVEGESLIQPGDKVLSINGVSISELYHASLEIIPADGYNKTSKVYTLNNYLRYILTDFFGYPNKYQVSFKRGEKTQTITIPALKDSIIRKEEASPFDSQNISFEYLNDSSLGYLKIRSFFDWAEDGEKISFVKRLQDIFDSLGDTKPPSLIIDLRGNGGGMQPWRLSSYFYDEPITYAKSAEFTITRGSPYFKYQELSPGVKFIKWRRFNKIGANKTKQLNDSTYLLTNLYLVKPFKALKPKYNGKVFVIIDGGSFSATALFASHMRSKNLATFIGQETGGSYYGNTSMSPSRVTLPISKIRVDIPLVRYQLNVKETEPFGRGIIPEFIINYSLDDILENRDLEMEKALELVKPSDKTL